MKLSREFLAELEQTQAILQQLALDTQRDIQWAERQEDQKGEWVTAPEVYNKAPEFLILNKSALKKYQTAISVLTEAITNQDISNTQLNALQETKIPALIQLSNKLKSLK